jgi:hypothetical protein
LIQVPILLLVTYTLRHTASTSLALRHILPDETSFSSLFTSPQFPQDLIPKLTEYLMLSTEHFGWVNSLAEPDVLLGMPICVVVTMLLGVRVTRLSTKTTQELSRLYSKPLDDKIRDYMKQRMEAAEKRMGIVRLEEVEPTPTSVVQQG